MPESHSRRRWWIPRYSLRTFIIVVLLIGGWIGWNLSLVRERTTWLNAIQAKANVNLYDDDEALPPWRASRMPTFASLFGAKPIKEIDLGNQFSLMDAKAILSRFPEAKVRWFDGKEYIDVQSEP